MAVSCARRALHDVQTPKALARVRNQHFFFAPRIDEARKAVREHAALEVALEVARDEAWQPSVVGALEEEGGEILSHRAMQRRKPLSSRRW